MEDGGHFLKPLASQRYRAAAEALDKVKPSFLIDFGCNECGFLFYISRNPRSLKYAIGLDLDASALRRGSKYFDNMSCKYINNLEFKIALFNGDVTKLDEAFIKQNRRCPFVTLLELIEHLHPSQVASCSHEIFGKLVPGAVYLTTPNADYNPILSKAYGTERKRRHPDHKFEWSRQEFYNYCSWVCSKFDYAVTIGGVGECSDTSPHNLGFASSTAFFVKYPTLQRTFTFPESCFIEILVNVNIDTLNL